MLEPDPKGPASKKGIVTDNPKLTAKTLYPNEEIDQNTSSHRRVEISEDMDDWPFTWRGALYVVDSIIRVITRIKPFDDTDRSVAQLSSVDELLMAVEKIPLAISNIEKGLDEIRAKIPDAEPDYVKLLERQEGSHLRTIEDFHLTLKRIGKGNHSNLIDEIIMSAETAKEWWSKRLGIISKLRGQILENNLDSEITVAEFTKIYDVIAKDRIEYMYVDGNQRLGFKYISRKEISLLNYANRGFGAALSEVAADLYVKSPSEKSKIPQKIIDRNEPKWRAVSGDRPHRMGGFHDNIHGASGLSSGGSVLLFQIASDDAMQWLWGDGGAYHVFITTDDLKRHRFEKIRSDMECH